VESHETILDAVIALLEKEGYRSLTIEGVARHAKVGKQTIYRWWKSRAELVLEAFAKHAAEMIPIPKRGSLETDLEAFLTLTFKRLTTKSGPIARGLIADGVLDPQFGKLFREVFVAKRRAALQEILTRGIKRGELAPDADLDLLTDLLFGPMWYRLLNQHARLNQRFARDLVRSALYGHAAISYPGAKHSNGVAAKPLRKNGRAGDIAAMR
jgi:AcrR family transcriptional regulator